MTAALGVAVRVVVVACLSDPAGARGAPPRAIGRVRGRGLWIHSMNAFRYRTTFLPFTHMTRCP